MIRPKDVIRMRIPYPSVNSKLATKPHMYICKSEKSDDYEFVKCQTFKPYMLNSGNMVHYIDEEANIQRNPFARMSRIDCDKIFMITSVRFDDRQKTTARPDVCDELFSAVLAELRKGKPRVIHINKEEIMQLNPLITEAVGLQTGS